MLFSGTLTEMEEAAKLIENDPRMAYEMHESVVSDCDEWYKRSSQKKNTNNKSAKQNKGKQKLISSDIGIFLVHTDSFKYLPGNISRA